MDGGLSLETKRTKGAAGDDDVHAFEVCCSLAANLFSLPKRKVTAETRIFGDISSGSARNEMAVNFN